MMLHWPREITPERREELYALAAHYRDMGRAAERLGYKPHVWQSMWGLSPETMRAKDARAVALEAGRRN